MLLRLTLYFFVLPLVKGGAYLYNTYDNFSVEFYDCITDTKLPYCRRPSEPITLQRDQPIWHCDHGGIVHNFSSLYLENVSLSTVFHQWNSSIEKAEEYALYIKQRQSNETISTDEKYLCQCVNSQSFGKRCEYLLPMGTTFQQTIDWEIWMRSENKWEMQRYSDIVCYTTLVCDSGLLCLDWRDICDGIQHCMYGYDEENCDTLEFNECEDDEYRCANGMCIPDEYFVDGEYDCADVTDEKEESTGVDCTFEEASYECDDRMCYRFEWSCGDGQCINYRLGFQFYDFVPQCNSLREQYYMCETHAQRIQWTLPNGKCYISSDYEETIEYNRTNAEKCLYFVKCALSQGAEENCPCKGNLTCINDPNNNPCPSSEIQYPNGAILAPYVFSVYSIRRDWSKRIPDAIVLNGTLKCRGYMIQQNARGRFSFSFNLQQLGTQWCAFRSDQSTVSKGGYDELCYNNSRTFNNHPHHFIDICDRSTECISAYRINDGYADCANDEDETLDAKYKNTCSHIQRHRFRCSNEQPTCLIVNSIGDEVTNCNDARDEWWMKRGIKLSKLTCHTQSKDGCRLIREYIEASWNLDTNNSSDQQQQLQRIPFRSFCDSFWNLGSGEDENTQMCHNWWKCPPNQWQCRSGQCIDIEWVLDGEWDCVDASDEQALFFSSNNISSSNLNLIDHEELEEKFNTLYKQQPFWNICNLSVEYPCFRANVSDHPNLTRNRPCISLSQIGDNHIDCAGGLDERNNLKHCRFSTMLGYHFQCPSTETCLPYHIHCLHQCDDNYVQCFGYRKASNCSEESDFMCLDGKCAERGWCNGNFECSYGEDELLCSSRKGSFDLISIFIYRVRKDWSSRARKKTIQLPQIPAHINTNQVTDRSLVMPQNRLIANSLFTKINLSIVYYCNRGIGVQLIDRSVVCFCPPQYYGDRCQFHNDRITFLFHLNLSQSIYSQSNNSKTVLNLVIIFLQNNQSLMTESFRIKAIDEIVIPRKKKVHLFYSRSNSSLEQKRSRYFNRSNIINEHPYSVRIEAYELNTFIKARLVGMWLYPVYFDFLPSFHLAKVLHLTQLDSIKNPCLNNSCSPHQECHPILNQNSTYVCLCPPNFEGDDCLKRDEMCEHDFCSSNALCKPNYRGTLMGNEEPFCICPLNETGRQCGLVFDQCDLNPCQNNGTCYSMPDIDEFICLCDPSNTGDRCQLNKREVRFQMKNIPHHRAAVVQYFDIDYFTLDLLLFHQHIHRPLSESLHYNYVRKTAPEIIVVKFYSDIENKIYLISIQFNVESINGTVDLNETYHCAHVQTLFSATEEINPMKYHHLCTENRSLLCSVDDSYLCVCEENHDRVECFGYDHDVDQCSSCLSGGQCLTENRSRSDFVCLCPQCHYGSVCQFNIEGIGFTLDSLIIQINRGVRFMYLVLATLIFLIGGMSNYASVVTFKRPNLRKRTMSRYMIVLSLISQYSLLSLVIKIILILFDSSMNDLSCKIISYLHSVSIRCSFWLISWIAIERVSYVLFPFSRVLKNLRVTTVIICITTVVVGLMHVHEMIFYRKLVDPNGQSTCIIDLSTTFRLYDRVTVLSHYLIPFSIQIFSITILIILAARSRSRTNNNRDPFLEYLKKQFKRQKELYIPPLVIIVSGLPQTILSFSFACSELITWQQHALLIAYFLSFAPQLLDFVLFVLPSSDYLKEFEGTKLSKTILFRWIVSKKKTQRK